MQPLAAMRDIHLTSEQSERCLVAGDAAMLEGAVAALIDNALRFARDSVLVTTSAEANGTTAITVSDDGPGFSAEGLREATRRFWRDDPARSGSGSGLGLAIVRTIAERHHGAIHLSNGGDGGAVVTVTLPNAAAAP
jgi:signal transduction histidine kinase